MKEMQVEQWKDLENRENCEKIRKIWMRSKLNCEKIWKIGKKGKLNSEKI